MYSMNPFASIFVFIAALAFSESILLMAANRRYTHQRRAARARLKRHATRIQRLDEREVDSIFLDSKRRGPILRMLTAIIPDRRPFDLWLYRSGIGIQLETFLGVTVLTGLIGLLLGNVISREPLYGLAGASLGLLPFMYIRQKKNQRMNAFVHEFPEAIELLCRSLKAGHPLQTGLRLVADEVAEPVSSELSQVVDEIAMGLDSRSALNNLAMRMNTQEMPFFINALLIQRETGGDLPSVLANLAKTARERIQFQIKVNAIVSQTRTSANVLAMFPALFMIFINFASPDYLDPLWQPGTGRLILTLAGIFTVLGWLLCRQLTAIKV